MIVAAWHVPRLYLVERTSPQIFWEYATRFLYSLVEGTYWLHRTRAFVGVVVRERTGLAFAWLAVAPN